MNIVIVNKSDSTGGAAVVSRRLMEALRAEGADARMLVVEKLSDSPYVEIAAPPEKTMMPFLAERLKIFFANGFDRSSLFKIDIASDGLPLWDHPLVKTADAVLLNWVNQGMLSLNGVKKILALGKPVVWTMHDMWCMTGICHHAGDCGGYRDGCGRCPLLGKLKSRKDISAKIWKRKAELYSLPRQIRFVAVSNWLKDKASGSTLLSDRDVVVVPNAFDISSMKPDVANILPDSSDESGVYHGEKVADGGSDNMEKERKIRIIFGAARIDDPIKGLPVLIEMTGILKEKYPRLADKMELLTFGEVKNPASLSGMGITHRHLGMVRGEGNVRKVYENADILVSSSSYETLPGTIVEAQAYGCIPVSLDRGGQGDIITHLADGYLAEFSDNRKLSAAHLADGVAWAAGIVENAGEYGRIKARMSENVKARFSAHHVASLYIKMLEEMMRQQC